MKSAIVSVLLLVPAVVSAAVDRNCGPGAVTINKAIYQANELVKDSADSLNNLNRLRVNPRYTTWFGSYSPSPSRNSAIVKGRFQKLVGNDNKEFDSITYDCTQSCPDGAYDGYVDPASKTAAITLCPSFFRLPLTGTNSTGGTLVRLASMLDKYGVEVQFKLQGTKLYAIGQDSCKTLATSNIEQAVANAFSIQYFAENMPRQ